MSVQTPDRWVVVEITEKSTGQKVQKVFAGWYGGYAGSDSWQMNSGIAYKVEHESHIDFIGVSGSVYRCHKKAYGMSSYMAGILNHFKKRLRNLAKIEISAEYGNAKTPDLPIKKRKKQGAPIHWKVSVMPVRALKDADVRLWPSAFYKDASKSACAEILCKEGYSPSKVKSGSHSPLKVHVAKYDDNGKPQWKTLTKRCSTLAEAKEYLADFLVTHPEFMPKALRPKVISKKKK
jgi:hypothetical protein